MKEREARGASRSCGSSAVDYFFFVSTAWITMPTG